VPGVLDDGVISPVELFIINPAGAAVYVPPEKAPVPFKVADAVLTVVQKGVPVYEMVAVGTAVMITEAVVVTAAHPPDAGVV
jgi:hypothetical protein